MTKAETIAFLEWISSHPAVTGSSIYDYFQGEIQGIRELCALLQPKSPLIASASEISRTGWRPNGQFKISDAGRDFLDEIHQDRSQRRKQLILRVVLEFAVILATIFAGLLPFLIEQLSGIPS